MKTAARIEFNGQTIGRILVDFTVEWTGNGQSLARGLDTVIAEVLDPEADDLLCCGAIVQQVMEIINLAKATPVQVIMEIPSDYGSSADIV